MAELTREQIKMFRDYLMDLDCPFDEKAGNALCDLALRGLDDAEDAERFRALQDMEPVKAQQFFWNYSSRKQRAAALLAAAKEPRK